MYMNWISTVRTWNNKPLNIVCGYYSSPAKPKTFNLKFCLLIYLCIALYKYIFISSDYMKIEVPEEEV